MKIGTNSASCVMGKLGDVSPLSFFRLCTAQPGVHSPGARSQARGAQTRVEMVNLRHSRAIRLLPLAKGGEI